MELGYDFWKYRYSDAATGRFWMVDPLGSQYAHNSLYAFQENKLGKGVELEGAELAEFGRYLGGVVSGIAEDISLGAFRAGSGSPEYNAGVSAGHKAFVAIGGTTTFLGTGLVGGSGVVTAGTLGAAAPATAVTATAGGALALYGGATTAKALSSVNSEGEKKGTDFNKKEKSQIIEKNKTKNDGKNVCENCGTETVKAEKSKKGISPPKNETQVDHIVPKSKGGKGKIDNGQVYVEIAIDKKVIINL